MEKEGDPLKGEKDKMLLFKVDVFSLAFGLIHPNLYKK